MSRHSLESKLSWHHNRGYYGWASFRKRAAARWLLARKSGYGRLRSAWLVAWGERS